MGTYRVQFEVIDRSVHAAWRDVEVEVPAESVDDAKAKAKEIARQHYGDNAKPTGMVTYFRPASG